MIRNVASVSWSLNEHHCGRGRIVCMSNILQDVYKLMKWACDYGNKHIKLKGFSPPLHKYIN